MIAVSGDHSIELIAGNIEKLLHQGRSGGVLFRDIVRRTLIFDIGYLRSTEECLRYINEEAANEFVLGYLEPSFRQPCTWRGQEGYPVLEITKPVSFEELDAFYQEEPAKISAAPISSWIAKGFIAPRDFSHFIWISGYWDIAVAAFSSHEDGEIFMVRHPHIYYMSQKEAEEYLRNPNDPNSYRQLSQALRLNLDSKNIDQ